MSAPAVLPRDSRRVDFVGNTPRVMCCGRAQFFHSCRKHVFHCGEKNSILQCAGGVLHTHDFMLRRAPLRAAGENIVASRVIWIGLNRLRAVRFCLRTDGTGGKYPLQVDLFPGVFLASGTKCGQQTCAQMLALPCWFEWRRACRGQRAHHVAPARRTRMGLSWNMHYFVVIHADAFATRYSVVLWMCRMRAPWRKKFCYAWCAQCEVPACKRFPEKCAV